MGATTVFRALTSTAGDAPTTGPTSTVLTAAGAQLVPWSGLIGFEGQATGDGRLIESNALLWDALPLPLRYVPADSGAHDGAVVVGTIDTLSRTQSGGIAATGHFDLSAPFGQEAKDAVESKRMDGVSMDLDDVDFEVRIKAELMQDSGDDLLALLMGEAPELGPTDEEGRVTVATINADDELMVTTSARIRAATLVSIPAFNEARIALAVGDAPPAGAPSAPDGAAPTAPADGAQPNSGTMPDGSECSCVEGEPNYDPDCTCTDQAPPQQVDGPSTPQAIAAGAIPDDPPAAWFSNPNLREATALTISPEGRVFGHLAVWGTCHISHTHGGCVTPPKSRAGYAYFHTGAVLTREGTEVPVGHITMDTRHAGVQLTAAAASAHYEHTGAVVADVHVGEDSYGIWVAGAIRPSASEAQIRALRASPLSGDWRRLSGNLELVAALAVNVPGFPVPRPRGLVAGGVAQALVASGMVPPRRVRRPGTPGALAQEDLRYLLRLARRERQLDQDNAAALARRVRASAMRVRVHNTIAAPKES
jgi:hypothetical protein